MIEQLWRCSQCCTDPTLWTNNFIARLILNNQDPVWCGACVMLCLQQRHRISLKGLECYLAKFHRIVKHLGSRVRT